MPVMKKYVRIVFLFFISFLYCYRVNAVGVALNKNLEEVSAGEIISIKISVEDIDIEEGVNTLQGRLEYDEKAFEKVTNKDFKTENNWSVVYNDEAGENEGKFVFINLSRGETENQEIANLELKVKPDYKGRATMVTVKDIYTVDNEDLVAIKDVKIPIMIEGKTENFNYYSIVVIIIILLAICSLGIIIKKKVKKK